MQNMKCNQGQVTSRSQSGCTQGQSQRLICYQPRTQSCAQRARCGGQEARTSCAEMRESCGQREWEGFQARSEEQAPISCNRDGVCGSGCAAAESECLSGMESLGMVYAPCQAFANLYNLDEGLESGTIFRELNMPFRPGYGCVNPNARRGCGR